MKVIDLFAGCGGLSLGFELAGFQIPLAIEKDLWASETYKKNHTDTKLITSDITKLENPRILLGTDEVIDGVIGGPPCQGFSLSGNRDKNDPRNSLFMDFVRFVKSYNPKFFLMENVTGILSMKTKSGEHVKDLIMNEYSFAGYNVHIIKVNAAHYGVPQARVRVVFIGIRKDFPFHVERLIPKIKYQNGQQITIDEAIMDLPQIRAGEGCDPMNYGTQPFTDFQQWARHQSRALHNHVAMRHTQRIIDRFDQIQSGQSIAHVEEKHKQRKRGEADRISGKTFSQNNMRPYGDKPAPTIAASFQSNFIHPHLNRNFTAREGARLQSFPDSYIFCGNRTTMSWEKNLSQYQQIGNAVPPLLAKALASNILEYFEKIEMV